VLKIATKGENVIRMRKKMRLNLSNGNCTFKLNA